MNDLRKAILTIIAEAQPVTGYVIMKVLRNLDIVVSHQQIYREVNNLEMCGFLSSTVKRNDGKPDSRHYSITPEGVTFQATTYHYARNDYVTNMGHVSSIFARMKKIGKRIDNLTASLNTERDYKTTRDKIVISLEIEVLTAEKEMLKRLHLHYLNNPTQIGQIAKRTNDEHNPQSA